METLTIFEDRNFCIPAYRDYEDDLLSLGDLIGTKHFSLQNDGTIHISHFVGFFQRGNTRIQILPKVYQADTSTEREAQESLEFVYRLLNWSGFLKHAQLPSQSIGTSNSDLLEIFIGLFIGKFNELFQRRSPRQYQDRVQTQQFVKGKILFSDTLRTYPVLRHLHIVATDELTIDNPLNRIFKAIINGLLKISKNPKNRKALISGLNRLEDVQLISLRKDHFDSIRFSRLTSEYLPLFTLARMFFFNRQPGMSDGDKTTYSLLIPLNELFESFVGGALEKLSSLDVTFRFKGNERKLLKTETDECMTLKPDFSAIKGHATIAILDAKYKCPWSGDKIDLSESDVYQICAYALRYDVTHLFLIYPLFVDVKSRSSVAGEYTIPRSNKNIKLFVVQVNILEKNLDSIEKTIQDTIYDLVNKIDYQPPALRSTN